MARDGLMDDFKEWVVMYPRLGWDGPTQVKYITFIGFGKVRDTQGWFVGHRIGLMVHRGGL